MPLDPFVMEDEKRMGTDINNDTSAPPEAISQKKGHNSWIKNG